MTDRADLPARLRGADMDHVSPVDILRLHDENPEAFPLSPEDVEAIVALIDEAAARIEGLEAALKPFALIARTEIRDDEQDSTKIPVRIGLVRTARSALTPESSQ